MTTGLIIPAAGSGERLGAGEPKAFAPLAAVPLVVHAARAAVNSGVFDVTVIAVPPGHASRVQTEVQRYLAPGTDLYVVDGGASRQESVRLALSLLPSHVDVVLVHDAARCLAPPGLFRDVATVVAGGHDAVVPVVPVVDTLKQVDDAGEVVATPDRSVLRAVQTPQGFRAATLRKAHRMAVGNGLTNVTDDAGLIEAMGVPVHTVPGHDDAFKITRPVDLQRAEAVIASREPLPDGTITS